MLQDEAGKPIGGGLAALAGAATELCGKWVMPLGDRGFRGGCEACQSLPEGAIRQSTDPLSLRSVSLMLSTIHCRLAREGARRMLAQVLNAEARFRRHVEGRELVGCRDRIVSRPVPIARPDGVGPVEVHRAKVRDRGEVGTEEKIRFSWAICRMGAADEEIPRRRGAGSLPPPRQPAISRRRLPPSWARTRRTCRRP